MTVDDRVDARAGKGTDFDGSDDYVELGNTASLQIGTDGLTLSAWTFPVLGGDNQGRRVFSKKADNATYGDAYGIYYRTGNVWRFRAYTGGASTAEVTSATVSDPNAWHYVAATYDGSTIRLYVNGQQEKTKAATFTIATNDLPLGIGSGADGYLPMQGVIDDVLIADRAFTAAEIAALYQGTV